MSVKLSLKQNDALSKIISALRKKSRKNTPIGSAHALNYSLQLLKPFSPRLSSTVRWKK